LTIKIVICYTLLTHLFTITRGTWREI